MNQFKEIYNTIEKLLNDKSISNYRINQDTGVSYGGISELRSGKRKVNKLTLMQYSILYIFCNNVYAHNFSLTIFYIKLCNWHI